MEKACLAVIESSSLAFSSWKRPMPTNQARIDLPPGAIDELIELAKAADSLPKILSATEGMPPQIGSAAVAKYVSEKVGLAVPDLRRLLSALLNYYHTQVKLKLSSAETAKVITESLTRASKTEEARENLRIWEQARAQIVEAVSQLHPDHPFEAAYKAFRVATTRQHELDAVKVLTDLRPVFNDAVEQVTQMIVTHILAIDYRDGIDRRIIEFSLDALDIAELKGLCERAERKAAILKKELRQMPWPTAVFREQPDPSE
jgi:hypothetical protein